MSEQQSLEFLLFSGAYDEVLRRTVDRHEGPERRLMIGALSLSGRLEEAESAFDTLAAGGPREDVAEARFFVIAGHCHAGNLARALRHAVASVPDVRAPDPRSRFFAYQGLAAVRYFQGFFPMARRLARRALRSAVAASFAYARFLALDLMSHVLVHTGEVYAGLRLLSQAEALADALGYADNAATERAARHAFELRMLLTDVDRALETVEAAVRAPEVSYFTRRNGLIELAFTFALRGQATRAHAALDEARQIALPGSDRRGKTRFLVCSALATALSRGVEAATPLIEEARVLAREQLTLTAEVAFVDLLIVGRREPELLREYAEVARKTGIARARVAAELATGAAAPSPRGSHLEDGLLRVFADCAEGTPLERVVRVLDARLHGLVPWALGRPPGRRILVLPRSIVTEHQGSVTVHDLPGRPSLKVLAAIARGPQTHATLTEEVWGINRFVPSRHLPVIHTAVSRLRLALGEPDWVVTGDDGYALAEGVEVTADAETAAHPTIAPPPSVTATAPLDIDRVRAFVQRHGPSSSADVASELKLSPSTALRLLRRLSDEGALQKVGSGRATRYRVPD